MAGLYLVSRLLAGRALAQTVQYVPRLTDSDLPAGLYWSAPQDPAQVELELHGSSHLSGAPVLTAQDALVIRGENLHALASLAGELEGKVDVVYIDPPYNTRGPKFSYNDNRATAEWLEFMAVRLHAARELLAPDGVIFISIDDRELGRLRVLCDEVFSEASFLGTITWERKSVPVNIGKAAHNLQVRCEYVLAYSRCARAKHPGFDTSGGADKGFSHTDAAGRPCRYEGIVNGGIGAGERPTLRFEILGMTPPRGKQWKIGAGKAAELLAMVPPRLAVVDGTVKKVVYPGDPGATSTRPFWSHLPEAGTAADGKRELDELIGKGHGFDTVKPVALIRELLLRVRAKDALVLDFFAGSGTTGQAVLEANARDGGHRRYILVTNDEGGICTSVTVPRLKAAHKKLQAGQVAVCDVELGPAV